MVDLALRRPALVLIVVQALLILALLTQRARKRKAEAVVRESEKRFRVMADTTPSLIWMCDAQGEITYLNESRLAFADLDRPQPTATYRTQISAFKFWGILWRRERDSNPRYPFRHNGFQDRRYQPLTHPSAGWEPDPFLQFIATSADCAFPRVSRSYLQDPFQPRPCTNLPALSSMLSARVEAIQTSIGDRTGNGTPFVDQRWQGSRILLSRRSGRVG